MEFLAPLVNDLYSSILSTESVKSCFSSPYKRLIQIEEKNNKYLFSNEETRRDDEDDCYIVADDDYVLILFKKDEMTHDISFEISFYFVKEFSFDTGNHYEMYDMIEKLSKVGNLLSSIKKEIDEKTHRLLSSFGTYTLISKNLTVSLEPLQIKDSYLLFWVDFGMENEWHGLCVKYSMILIDEEDYRIGGRRYLQAKNHFEENTQ